MYVCMYVSNRFTIEEYEFYVQAPHCHVHTQCDKHNDKLGKPVTCCMVEKICEMTGDLRASKSVIHISLVNDTLLLTTPSL